MVATTMPATTIQEETKIRGAEHENVDTEKRNSRRQVKLNV
jgi:hypothetical protein